MKKALSLVLSIMLLCSLFVAVIPVTAATQFVLDNCESTSDATVWNLYGTGGLIVQTENPLRGNACLEVPYYNLSGTHYRHGYKLFSQEKDSGFTSYGQAALSFWIYVSDASRLSSASITLLDRHMAAAGADANTVGFVNGWSHTLPTLTSGVWNHVVMPLSSGSAALDVTAITGYYFVSTSTISPITVYLDDIRLVTASSDNGVTETKALGSSLTSTPTTVLNIDNCDNVNQYVSQDFSRFMEGSSSYIMKTVGNNYGIFPTFFENPLPTGITQDDAGGLALSFWMFVDSTTALDSSVTTYLDISSGNVGDGDSALRLSLDTMAGDLSAGQWNHVVIPLSQVDSSTFMWSYITGWRLVVWMPTSDVTIWMDDIRFITYDPEDDTGVVEKFMPPLSVDKCEAIESYRTSMYAVEGNFCYSARLGSGSLLNFTTAFDTPINTGLTNNDIDHLALSFWMFTNDNTTLSSADAFYLHLSSGDISSGTEALEFNMKPWATKLTNGRWQKITIPLSAAINTSRFAFPTLTGWRMVVYNPSSYVTVKIDDLQIVSLTSTTETGISEIRHDGYRLEQDALVASSTLGTKIRNDYATDGTQALCFGTTLYRTVQNGKSYVFVDGERYELKDMGGLLMSEANVNALPNGIYSLDADNVPSKAIKVPAKYLWSQDDTQMTFTIILTGIDQAHLCSNLVMRPYFLLEDEKGVTKTFYGEAITRSVSQTGDYANSGEKGTVYIADYVNWLSDPRMADTQYHYDIVMLAVALQGRLNPLAPTLYINDGNTMEYFEHMRKEADDDLYGYKKYTISTIDEFLNLFAGYIRSCGLVAWDENVPATSTISATVCGVHGYLPVRYSTSTSSLYYTLTSKLSAPVHMDLTNRFTGTGTIWDTNRASTGSKKCDAYVWAIEKLLPYCSYNYLGYITDAAFIPYVEGRLNPLRDYNIIATTLPDLDFLIAQKAFCFDLYMADSEVPHDDVTQPIGTDRATLEEILLKTYQKHGGTTFTQVVAYPNFFFKYNDVLYPAGYTSSMDNVAREFLTGKIFSSYNCVVDGDCGGYFSMFNCSIYSRHKMQATYQNNIPTQMPTYDPSKRYVSVYMGDYDGGAWLGFRAAEMFNEPSINDIPISWPINPNLLSRMGAVFDYVLTKAPASSNFIAGEGAGYVYPGWIIGGDKRNSISGLPDATQAFINFSKYYYDRLGITATAFAHNGDSFFTHDELRPLLPFSPDGIGSFYWSPAQPNMVDGTPVIGTGRCIITESTSTQDCVNGIIEILNEGTNEFGLIIANCTSPTKLAEVYATLQAYYPDIVILDNYSFFNVIEQALT